MAIVRYLHSTLLAASFLAVATWSPFLLAAPQGDSRGTVQSDEKTSAKNKQAASKLLAEGNALSNDGEYLEALDKFKAAYALYPSPKLLLNVGTMQRQLGRNVDAARTYETYLRDPDADPNLSASLARTLGEIDALVGHMQIIVTPNDATLSLDGLKLQVSSGKTSVRVEPGTHKIVAEKSGFPPAVQTVTVKRGETIDVSLKLAHAPIVVRSVVVKQPLSAGRIAAFVVGGLGLTGLLVSAGTSIGAYEKNKQALQSCDLKSARCDADGIVSANAALTLADVSTYSFLIGGLTTGVGLIILASSRSAAEDPAKKAASISFVPHPSGGILSIGATF